VIKLKSNLSATVKKFHELQQDINQEAGLEINADGSYKFLDENTDKHITS